MKRIKAERLRRGLTQMDIAKMCDIYPSDVSRAERGVTWGEHAEKIAEALGIDPRNALDEVEAEIHLKEATNPETEEPE